VYADVDVDGRIVLTTENGYPDDPRNRIVLEPEVLAAFESWVARLRRETRRRAAMIDVGLDPDDESAPRHVKD
jgi:hypothetical protein